MDQGMVVMDQNRRLILKAKPGKKNFFLLWKNKQIPNMNASIIRNQRRGEIWRSKIHKSWEFLKKNAKENLFKKATKNPFLLLKNGSPLKEFGRLLTNAKSQKWLEDYYDCRLYCKQGTSDQENYIEGGKEFEGIFTTKLNICFSLTIDTPERDPKKLKMNSPGKKAFLEEENKILVGTNIGNFRQEQFGLQRRKKSVNTQLTS